MMKSTSSYTPDRQADQAAKRRFNCIIESAPDIWHAYRCSSGNGIPQGILEVNQGFEAVLAFEPRCRQISLSVLASNTLNKITSTLELLLRLQEVSRLARAIPDETGALRFHAAIHCPDCPDPNRYCDREHHHGTPS